MLTQDRAAQFHNPQVKELFNYIEKEKLEKPRGGKKAVLLFVENYIRSAKGGDVVTNYPGTGGDEANDEEEDLEGEDYGDDDEETGMADED